MSARRPTDSAYLAGLGGLTAHRRVIRLDLRGTGRSATPRDTASCRCGRLVDDVEALGAHLGVDRMDLLAHCAAANPAVLCASRRPDGVGRLVLVTPSVRAVGLTITGDLRLRTARLRREEPWFPEAFAALETIVAGEATPDRWKAVAPFSHGRWDAAAEARQAIEDERMNPEIVAAFAPAATRAAPARFARPVLLLSGEFDPGALPAPRPSSRASSRPPSSSSGPAPGTTRGATTPTGSWRPSWRFLGPTGSSSQPRPSPAGGRDHGTPSSKSA
ncbi:hypothetical protein GCM10010300_76670 [Streptomyces olivaceoviridis]|nr:hypothetical protein GCM10010300_76670 [Streptomyces olivaceoviridis]